MTHERAGRILAGLTVLASVTLGYFHHPLWFIGTAGAAFNLALSGITDRCVVKDLLVRMGFPGERDLGRAEAQKKVSPHPRPSTRLESLGRVTAPARTHNWQSN